MPLDLLTVAKVILLLWCNSTTVVEGLSATSSRTAGRELQERPCDEVIGTVIPSQLKDAVRLFVEPLVPPEDVDATVTTLTLPADHPVRVVKLCGSCQTVRQFFIDQERSFSVEFENEFCNSGAYGYSDEQSTLVFLPVDPATNEVVSKVKLRAFLSLHEARTDVSSAPTQVFPSNITALIDSVRSGSGSMSVRGYQWFMTDVIAALLASATGAIGLVPDLQGYGTSQSTVNRTQLFLQGYHQASIIAYFGVQDYLLKTEGGCTKLATDTVSVLGVGSSGLAVPAVGLTFHQFKAKPIMTFTAGSPMDMSTFLRDAVENYDSLNGTAGNKDSMDRILSLTAFSYSADTPGFVNTPSQQRLVNPAWNTLSETSTNLVRWFSNPSPWTEAEIAEALPLDTRETLSPDLLQLFSAAAAGSEDDPCRNSSLVQETGNVDQLCAALVNASAWHLINIYWNLPIQLCFSPSDEVVNASTQYSTTIRNHKDISIYPGPPGFEVLKPVSPSHFETLQKCVIAPILYLSLGGVKPTDPLQQINYQEELSLDELASCESVNFTPTKSPTNGAPPTGTTPDPNPPGEGSNSNSNSDSTKSPRQSPTTRTLPPATAPTPNPPDEDSNNSKTEPPALPQGTALATNAPEEGSSNNSTSNASNCLREPSWLMTIFAGWVMLWSWALA